MRNRKRSWKLSILAAGLLGNASLWAEGGEISVYGGGVRGSGSSHAVVGGSAGVNPSQKVRLFGEFNYVPLGSASYSVGTGGAQTSYKASARLLNFGGGLDYNFTSASAKVTPYATAVVGNGHTSVSASTSGPLANVNGSVSGNNIYLGGGAGLRVPMGKNWGIRPELRYQRYLQDGAGGLLFFTVGAYFGIGKN